MDVVLKTNFRVLSYDVDPFGDVRPSAIMNYLQETAGLHSSQWNVSVRDLFKAGKTWVISRYHLRLLRRTRIGEEVEITTWSSSRGDRFSTRDFEIKSHTGEVVALATTSFAVIDLKERKLVPLDDSIPKAAVVERRVIENPFPALPSPDSCEREIQIPVMLRDLDMNGHVNHVVYVQWGLEAVPLDIWREYRPSSIEISYRAETHYGEAVKARIQVERSEGASPVILHQIVNAGTGTELARLRTRWEKFAPVVRPDI